MKAVILAGGKGTRLRPFSVVFPKPMVPIGEMPVLAVVLGQLQRAGFTDVTIALGHLGELIQAYFQCNPVSGLTISYAREARPTGTAGALRLIEGLAGSFLVMNGDILTTLDFRQLMDFHQLEGSALTIATNRRAVNIDLGVLKFDETGRLVDYIEKPEYSFDASMGIYAYSERTLSYIEPGGVYLDFPQLVLKLLAAGEKISAYRSEDYWLDIGRPEDYSRAQDEFEKMKSAFGLE